MRSRSHARATLAASLCLFALCARAETLQVEVVDKAGAPVADAVVYAIPVNGKPSKPPQPAVIDQVHRQFAPMVSVIQTGAMVTFPNKDNFEHDVYSFSPAKTFELKLYHGVAASPVQFDKPGLVVMGCNIHDMMIAYVLVVDTPYFAKTDASGKATINDLPADGYRVSAWQYRMKDGAPHPTQTLTAAPGSRAKFTLDLQAQPA